MATCPNPCGVITLNSGNVRLDWCGQIGCGCEGEEEDTEPLSVWCGEWCVVVVSSSKVMTELREPPVFQPSGHSGETAQ